MFKILFSQFLDLILPRSCLGCGVYDTWACDACLRAFRFPTSTPAAPPPLTRIYTLGSYATPFWREAVHVLKFSGVREIAQPLGVELARAAEQLLVPSTSLPALIPVPLHPQRFRERGYNQAQLLATVISQETGWPLYDELVIRTTHTTPQTELALTDRTMNVLDAFCLSPTSTIHNTIRGIDVLLVDDVITTGATAAAIAHALLPCKPRSISVLAVARGH